jgi:hypothetical protein
VLLLDVPGGKPGTSTSLTSEMLNRSHVRDKPRDLPCGVDVESASEHARPIRNDAVPPEDRNVIYTTNMIVSINYRLRKISKTRGHFQPTNP